jgi:hypothetical protein
VTSRSDLDQRWQLADLREFLLRSLHDAEVEHEAGDLSEDDYQMLVTRDQARLSTVESELAQLAALEISEPSVPDPTDGVLKRRPWRPRRWVGVSLAVAAVISGLVLLVVDHDSSQLPGQTFDGTVTLNSDQQVQRELSQAATLVQQNHVVDALQLYRQILKSHPDEPEALAEAGWIEWQAGQEASDVALMNTGASLVQKAVRFEPSLGGAHLFLGIIDLRQDHDAKSAVVQFQLFFASHPANGLIVSAAPSIQQAYAQADVALPSSVAAVINNAG